MTIKTSMILLLFLAITAVFIEGCSSPPEDVEKAMIGGESQTNDISTAKTMTIDAATSTFEFEGYAPGKSHLGSFEDFTGMLYVMDNKIVGAKGTVIANSLETGIDGLDKHLRSDDFFDVETYPEITFESTSIVDGTMSGTLNFHGVTQTISFPVTMTENSLSADFLLDSTAYNLKYVAINKDIRIMFTMRI